jgi:hypothetical protein
MIPLLERCLQGVARTGDVDALRLGELGNAQVEGLAARRVARSTASSVTCSVTPVFKKPPPAGFTAIASRATVSPGCGSSASALPPEKGRIIGDRGPVLKRNRRTPIRWGPPPVPLP